LSVRCNRPPGKFGYGRIAGLRRSRSFDEREEKNVRRHSVLGGMVTGAIAGAAATWVMDLVTTGVAAGDSKADKKREKAAQANGKSSVENLLELIEATTGMQVDEAARPMALQALHYALGAGPGAAYGALRGRMPLIGAGRGLLFGAALFAVNDEYVNTALGLSGPPEAYPTSSHLRGLIGHLALGVTTDLVLDLL
jgi:hypothetical protein